MIKKSLRIVFIATASLFVLASCSKENKDNNKQPGSPDTADDNVSIDRFNPTVGRLFVRTAKSGLAAASSGINRKIVFNLYSDHAFSYKDRLMTFKLSVHRLPNEIERNSIIPFAQNRTLPETAQRGVFENNILSSEAMTLKIGFYHKIENVRFSSQLKSSDQFQNKKIVILNSDRMKHERML